MLHNRDSALRDGRRREGGAASRPIAFHSVAADPGPVILTRAELQRRTRERSRLAALKLAEANGKEREQRETAARRKSAARAISAQARHDNAVRFRRETSSAGPPAAGGRRVGGRRMDITIPGGDSRARSHSPRAAGITARRRSQTTPSTVHGSGFSSGEGGDGDEGSFVASSKRSQPRPNWQQRQQQQQQQGRRFRAETSRPAAVGEHRGGIGIHPSNVAGTAAAAAPTTGTQPRDSRPRLSRLTSGTHCKDEEPPLPPLRRRVLRSRGARAQPGGGLTGSRAAGAGSGGKNAAIELAVGKPPEGREASGAGGLRGDGDVSRGSDDGGRDGGGDGGSDGGGAVPLAQAALRESIPASASSSPMGVDAVASAHGREKAPAAAARARTATPSRGRGGDTSSATATESLRGREEATTREESEKQDQQQWRRREREQGGEDGGQVVTADRHRATLAFMARQRKQATMEKRRVEREKLDNAENLRRALEKLEQTRRQGLSQQRAPLRSRSRENMHASRLSSSATAPPPAAGLSRYVPAAARHGRRRSHGASFADTTSGSLPRPPSRPAWVGVAGGGLPPPDVGDDKFDRTRAAAQAIRRRPLGKENRGEGGGGGGGMETGRHRLRRQALPSSSSRIGQPRSTSIPGRGRKPDEGHQDQGRGKSAPAKTNAGAPPHVNSRSRKRKGGALVNPSARGGGSAGTRSGLETAGNGNSHPPPYNAIGRQTLRHDNVTSASAQRRRWRPPDGAGGRDDGRGVDEAWAEAQSRVVRGSTRRVSGAERGVVRAGEAEAPVRRARGSGQARGSVTTQRFRAEPSPPTVSRQGDDVEGEFRGRKAKIRRQKEEERDGGGGDDKGSGTAAIGSDKDDDSSLDDRLPFMLESLKRVALTVHDLQGRCARLSRVLDEPRPARPRPSINAPARTSPVLATTEAYNNGPSRIAGVFEQLSALSDPQPLAPAAAPAAADARIPRPTQHGSTLQPRSTEQPRLDRSRRTTSEHPERPMVSAPTPVTLPPRQPPPVLWPMPTPRDYEHELRHQHQGLPGVPPSHLSPAISLAFSTEENSAALPGVAAGREVETGTSRWNHAVSHGTSRASPPPSASHSTGGTKISTTAGAASLRDARASVRPVDREGGLEIPSLVEKARASPLGLGPYENDSRDGPRSRQAAVAERGIIAGTGAASRLSEKASDSGIGAAIKKLRESSGGAVRGADRPSTAKGSRREIDDQGNTAGLSEGRRRGSLIPRRSERATETAAAPGEDDVGLPEWMPRARVASPSALREVQRERSSRSKSSSSSSSSGSRSGGGRSIQRGGANAMGFSLVSIIAGDIVRAQREAATKRRQGDQATAAIKATAAAPQAREQPQGDDVMLAASENTVAEAVRAAARVVATEEAARNGTPATTAAMMGGSSAVSGVEAIEDVIAALEQRRMAGGDDPASDSVGEVDEVRPRHDSNRPDLWDFLLQSGPTLSPTRRQRLQGEARPTASPTESHGEFGDGHDAEAWPLFEDTEAAPGGAPNGGDGGEERTGRRRRRLAPADLQAQLLNELRLHDDLQDAELQADGLLAAHRVEEARQQARVASLLLQRERNMKAQADSLLEQQRVFEDALADNDASHVARLRRLERERDEQAARQAETAAVAVAEASATALRVHGQQAVAAVGERVQTQQASAMAAQSAMFLEFQERALQQGRLMAKRGARGGRQTAGRDRLSEIGSLGEELDSDCHEKEERRQVDDDGWTPRRDTNDFDSLLEHSPVRNSHRFLHDIGPSPAAAAAAGAAAAAAAAAAAQGQRHFNDGQEPGFWSPESSLSPEQEGRKPAAAPAVRGVSRNQAQDGGDRRQQQARHQGPASHGPRSRHSEREVSPVGHVRHSYDGPSHSAAGGRRQQQGGGALAAMVGRGNANGNGGSGLARVSSLTGEGGVVDAHDLDALLDYRMAALRDSARRQQRSSSTHMELVRRSGPLGGAGRGVGAGVAVSASGVGIAAAKGDASVEYAAVRREIELEREAMSRRTQEQLRELERGDSGRSEDGGPRDEEDGNEEERYTSSFGSTSNQSEDQGEALRRRHRRPEEDTASRQDEISGGNRPFPPPDDDVDEIIESLSPATGRDEPESVTENVGDGSLRLAESLALELQESVVPLAAAGRPLKAAAAASGADPIADGRPGGGGRRGWPEDDDANTIPDEIAVASSPRSVSSAPGVVFPTISGGGGDLGPVGLGAKRSGTERLKEGSPEVPEEVQSFDQLADEAPQDLASIPDDPAPVPDDAASVDNDLASVPEDAASVDDDLASVPDGSDRDEGDKDRSYNSVSFEADEEAAEEPEPEAAEASEMEAERSSSNATAAAASTTTAAAAQYSHDFEPSSPLHPAGAATASGPLVGSSQDGAVEGLLSPPALSRTPEEDATSDGGGGSSGGGGRGSGSPSRLLRPGSSGSLAAMEAAVVRRRRRVQQMRAKLDGLQESRERVRAKRALAEQLEVLEAEEVRLSEQLPVQEAALAEDEKELQHAMAREHRAAEARYPTVMGAVASSIPSSGLGQADDGARGQRSPPSYCAEKLWSDSDSDRGGGNGNDGDAGVEESMLSAAPSTVPAGLASEAVGEEESAADVDAAPPPKAAVEPDLLADGGYIDAGPANPPALADWIAFGAAEARDALATFDEPKHRRTGRPAEVQKSDAAGTAEAAEADDSIDVDEDSFCSSDGIGGNHGAMGGEESDVDSEARLTALVARVAVRGEESRAALIVQALVRGRAARRFAAVERGRQCAREEREAAQASAATAAAAAAVIQASALPSSPPAAVEDGSARDGEEKLWKKGAIEDMAWLARKERQEGLSDSFGSSDSGRGAAALLAERKAKEVAAHEQEYVRLSKIAREDEDAAVSAGVAAMVQSQETQELPPATQDRRILEAAAIAQSEGANEPVQRIPYRFEMEVTTTPQSQEALELVQSLSTQDGREREAGKESFLPKSREGADAGFLSEPVAEEVLEERFVDEVHGVEDVPETWLRASSPAVDISSPMKTDCDETGDIVERVCSRRVSATADTINSEARRDGGGGGITDATDAAMPGRSENELSNLRDYDYLQTALPPTMEERGRRGQSYRPGDNRGQIRLEGLGFEDVEDAVFVDSAACGVATPEADAQAGEVQAVDAVGRDPTPSVGTADAAGVTVRLPAAAASAAAADDGSLQHTLEGCAGSQASNKSADDGVYSESFEEDQDDEGYASELEDSGLGSGDRDDDAGKRGAGAMATDAGEAPEATVDEERMLSSVSEVCSDEFLAQAHASFGGSFSIGQDYLEDAVLPADEARFAAGEEKRANGDLAAGAGASPWQALIFSPSPPTERDAESGGAAAADANATSTGNQGPPPGVIDDGPGSLSDGVGAAAAGHCPMTPARRGDGVVAAEQQPPDKGGIGLPPGQTSPEVDDDVAGEGEVCEEVEKGRKEMFGDDWVIRDDGGVDDMVEELLLPSPAETLVGADETGSFDDEEDHVLDKNSAGMSPPLAEVAEVAVGGSAKAAGSDLQEEVGGVSGGSDSNGSYPSEFSSGKRAPRATDVGSGSPKTDEADGPAMGVDARGRCADDEEPVDAARRVSRSDSLGSEAGDGRAQSLNGSYCFIEDAERVSESARRYGGDDVDGHDESGLHVEGLDAGDHQSRGTPPHQESASTAEEPQSVGDSNGADYSISNPISASGVGEELGRPYVVEHPANAQQSGESVEAVDDEPRKCSGDAPGVWAGEYDFEEDAFAPPFGEEEVSRTEPGTLAVERGHDISDGAQRDGDRLEGGGTTALCDESVSEVDAVPSRPKADPRDENEASGGRDGKELARGIQRGGDKDGDDGEVGTWSREYDFEESAVGVDSVAKDNPSTDAEEKYCLPLLAAETTATAEDPTKRRDGGEPSGCRDGAADDAGQSPADEAVVADDHAVQQVDETLVERELPYSEPSFWPIASLGVASLESFDHVEVAMGPSPARRDDVNPTLRPPEEQGVPSPPDSARSDERHATTRHSSSPEMSAHEDTRSAGSASGDLAVAVMREGSDGESVGRVEDNDDGVAEGQLAETVSNEAAESNALPATAGEPAVAAVDDSTAGRCDAEAAAAAAATDRVEASESNEEEAPAASALLETAPTAAEATAPTDEVAESDGEQAPAASLPDAAPVAAAGEAASPASAATRSGEVKEQLVDEITDHLLASLLTRALSMPPTPKTTTELEGDGIADVLPTDAVVSAPPSRLDEAPEERAAVSGDDRGSGPCPAAEWRPLTSDDDTELDDDGEEAVNLDGAERRIGTGVGADSGMTAAVAEDWDTAAMTETYRSEEGMFMVVRANSDDGGGSPQQQDLRLGLPTPPPGGGGSGNGGASADLCGGLVDEEEEDDEYYFPALPLARLPNKPWMALVPFAGNGNGSGNAGEGQDSCKSFKEPAEGEVSFGVRSGGSGSISAGRTGAISSNGRDNSPAFPGTAAEEAQVSFGVRSGGGGTEEDVAAGEAREYGEGVGEGHAGEVGHEAEGGEERFVAEEEAWPEYPWWPVLADAIEAALRSMSLDELNSRMDMHYLPEEPYIEELEGQDGMEFPPPPEQPLEDEAVIPPRVIDELLDAPDQEVLASLDEMEGIPKPDRDALDSIRWMAYDAANEYLAEQRSRRAPRRPQDAPLPSGKLLHRLEGFRHFRSIDEAVQEVTHAVLGQDGACLPGRGQNPDFVEMLPLDNKAEDWIFQEDDTYFLKCKVAEDILEELLGDTVQECRQVFSLRDQAQASEVARGKA